MGTFADMDLDRWDPEFTPHSRTEHTKCEEYVSGVKELGVILGLERDTSE